MSIKKDSQNTIAAIRYYIDKIVSDPLIGGMKALILDSVTTKIISMVYSQTQILEKEVYLVEQLGKRHEPMSHLKAAVFIQPTKENVDILCQEILRPKFKEYHLFFSNILPNELLQKIGKIDEHDMIMQVQEYYADYMAVNEDFFHLGINNSILLSSPFNKSIESAQAYERNLNGIISVLLSLKRKPTQVRYQSGSNISKRLANDVLGKIEKEESLFEFRQQGDALLLILDRKDDPITPLLTQWTYQAMVHELLGLNSNRVILKRAPNVSKELEEVVLSATQDDFFAKHRYANFGDLGVAVKQLLEDYQRASKKNENINSIEDMQSFLERYPDFRSKSLNVSKHVAVIGELSRLTDVGQLLDISEIEQEISCTNEHSNHKNEVLHRIRNPKVDKNDKLRLAILFILKYESYNEIQEFKSALISSGLTSSQVSIVDLVIEYAGESKRSPGLFSGGGFISKLGKTFSSSLGGVQNVYTQHQPLLSSTLDMIFKGKLKESAFPPLVQGSLNGKFSEIIVFIVGGATFEEATKVAELNSANSESRVILGGSCVQNSTSFLSEISKSF